MTETSLRIFDAPTIRAAIGIGDVLDPVAQALMAFSRGDSLSPPISFIPLENGGEVHLKSGYAKGSGFFVTKLATMVPANRARNIATSNGLMMLCSAETGYPVAVLHDRKYLTDIRTAAVGALAANLLAPTKLQTVGVLGTGGQAFLQMRALSLVRSFENILIWGRDASGAARLVGKLQEALPDKKISVVDNPKDIVQAAQVIITATASKEPLIRGAWLQPGTHITALGADDQEKSELDEICFSRAAFVACDSRSLVKQFGEIAQGIASRSLPDDIVDAELGDLLADPLRYARQSGDITISKHVGIGIEDLFVAEACYNVLGTNT